MIVVNKTKVVAGFFMGAVLLTAGCVSDRQNFSQESSVEDTSVDISAAAEAGSSGAGASATSASVPVGGKGGVGGGAGGAGGVGNGT